ncbi:MAG: CBS domain-containing protein [Clostridia bacterium]|nr:CBS domain-containing protein [Clostridia bacterium]MBR6780433.1 CBS domain-containing protein [Clostridia bacterium]
MNIMRFLTPKAEVEYLESDFTLRQGLEKMKYHGYAEIPVIDEKGRYFGSVTLGDFLWALYDDDNPKRAELEKLPLKNIIRPDYNPCVTGNVSIDAVLNKAITQNFVPVVDDRGVFIGIIKRSTIIRYLATVKTDLQNQEN